jgi:hypothetical protein
MLRLGLVDVHAIVAIDHHITTIAIEFIYFRVSFLGPVHRVKVILFGASCNLKWMISKRRASENLVLQIFVVKTNKMTVTAPKST